MVGGQTGVRGVDAEVADAFAQGVDGGEDPGAVLGPLAVAPLLHHGYHRALLLAALVVLAGAAAAVVLRIGFPHDMVVVRHTAPPRQRESAEDAGLLSPVRRIRAAVGNLALQPSCRRKAEGGGDVECRRPATTPQMRVPDPRRRHDPPGGP